MTERMLAQAKPPLYFEADLETMPRNRLLALQETLLALTVQRARRSPFFHERLQRLTAPINRVPVEQFRAEVPLTSKQDLRGAGTRAWAEHLHERISLLLGTSGTTGSRIALPYTAHDLKQWQAIAARTLWTNGLRPSDVVLLPVPLGVFTGGHGMFGGLERLGCAVIPLGVTPTPGLIEALQGGFGLTPTAIVTLPSHMLRLLESLPTAGYDPAQSPLRLGSFGAEAWTEAARARIETGFGIMAADSYGIGELCGPGVAAECELRDGMHIWEDMFLPEIVDPATGEPLPDGETGELVITPLFREALPLLRYRTGDESRILPEPCQCGRTHRRIARIARRVDDILVITGVNVDPADVERVLYRLPWIGNEFYLEAGGEDRPGLVLHAEHRADAPDDAAEMLAAAIRRIYPVRVDVRLSPLGQLERLPGKAKRLR